jgi:hypothetical protein
MRRAPYPRWPALFSCCGEGSFRILRTNEGGCQKGNTAMSGGYKKGKPKQFKVKTYSRANSKAASKAQADSQASEVLTKPLAEEAKDLRGTLGFLAEKLERLSRDMEKAELSEYVNLMHRPWQLLWRNFIAGLSRGVGIALGFTFFAATIVYLLQILGKLNLPIVGDFIANIVRIVQRQLQINPY